MSQVNVINDYKYDDLEEANIEALKISISVNNTNKKMNITENEMHTTILCKKEKTPIRTLKEQKNFVPVYKKNFWQGKRNIKNIKCITFLRFFFQNS